MGLAPTVSLKAAGGERMNRYRTPTAVLVRNAAIFVTTMVATVAVARLLLHTWPDSDLDVGRYNVHHLFSGLVLIVAGGVPLALFRGNTPRLDLALVLFAAGLGLALDEWVYLIVTDGSNQAYLTRPSLWGAIIWISLAAAYAGWLVALRLRTGKSSDD